MRHPFRFRLQGGIDHRLDPFRAVGRLAAPAWCDFPEASQSLRDKTFAPKTDCFPIDLHRGSDAGLGSALAGRENDAAAERHLLRRS